MARSPKDDGDDKYYLEIHTYGTVDAQNGVFDGEDWKLDFIIIVLCPLVDLPTLLKKQ